jgi:GGDEF domain-containing protein
VLILDLDRFKTVNDTLGHSAGDEMITTVADRLLQCTRQDDAVARGADFNGPPRSSDDFLARMGGDEFTILIEDVHSEADVASVAERIQHQLSAPFLIAGRELRMAASIGIALSDSRCSRADDVLRYADAAMYRAKALGGNQSSLFTYSVQ